MSLQCNTGWAGVNKGQVGWCSHFMVSCPVCSLPTFTWFKALTSWIPTVYGLCCLYSAIVCDCGVQNVNGTRNLETTALTMEKWSLVQNVSWSQLKSKKIQIHKSTIYQFQLLCCAIILYMTPRSLPECLPHLWARLGAAHDGVTAIHWEGILEFLQTLLGELVLYKERERQL